MSDTNLFNMEWDEADFNEVHIIEQELQALVGDAAAFILAQPPVNQAQPPVNSQPPVNQAQPPVNSQPPVNQAQPPVNSQPPVNQAQPPVNSQPPVNQAQPPVNSQPPVNAYLLPVRVRAGLSMRHSDVPQAYVNTGATAFAPLPAELMLLPSQMVRNYNPIRSAEATEVERTPTPTVKPDSWAAPSFAAAKVKAKTDEPSQPSRHAAERAEKRRKNVSKKSRAPRRSKTTEEKSWPSECPRCEHKLDQFGTEGSKDRRWSFRFECCTYCTKKIYRERQKAAKDNAKQQQ